MVHMLDRSLSGLMIVLACCIFGSPSSPAQGLPTEIGAEVNLGKNLTNDECVLRHQAPEGWGASAERYQVFCEGWSQPSGQLVKLPDEQRPLSWWIDESPWAMVIQSGGDCDASKPEARIEGFEAMTRKCLVRQGWRRLMLATRTGGDVFAADFLPNNAPLIERALMAGAKRATLEAKPQGQRIASLNALEEMTDKAVPLVSIKNISQLQSLSRLAISQFEAREYRKSELTNRQVLSIQEQLVGLQSPALALTLLHMSEGVRNQRRIDESDALLARAGKLADRSNDPVLLAFYLWSEAYNAGAHGRREEAVGFAQKAVAMISPHEKTHHLPLGHALGALGSALFNNQNYADAEQAARRSFKIFDEREGEGSVWGNRQRMVLIKALIAEGKLAEARPLIVSTLASAEKYFGHTIWWATAKAIEGEYYRAAGDTESALQSYRAFGKVAAHESYACNFGPCLPPWIDLLQARVNGNPASGQALLAEAFEAAQLTDSPVVNAAIAQMAARASVDNPKLQDVVRSQQDLDEQQTQIRAELSAETVKAAEKRNPQREAELFGQLQSIRKKIDDGELLLQDRFPHYAQLLSRAPIDAKRIQSLLGADEGLLYIALLGQKGYSFLVQPGRIAVHPISLSGAEVRDKVTTLRKGVSIPEGPSLPEFDAVSAHELFRALIGDLLEKASGLKRLIVVPSGPLLSLPPDLLVMTPPTKGTQPDWLARHYPILVTPDVRSIQELRGVAKPKALGTSFFGIGNPDFTSGAPSHSRAKMSGPCSDRRNTRAEVAGLPRLPETEEEVRAMSVSLGGSKAEIVLSDRAKKSALKSAAFSSADIIAFATHGLLPEDLYCEDEPSLALTPGSATEDDGLLRASEVSAMRIKADLVILSACNTAGADGRLSGETLSGLVRAFFFAGARNLLATHWSIASKQTVALTTGMIARAAKGAPLAEALQGSKLDLMNAKETAHPIFWAGFTLIGGG